MSRSNYKKKLMPMSQSALAKTIYNQAEALKSQSMILQRLEQVIHSQRKIQIQNYEKINELKSELRLEADENAELHYQISELKREIQELILERGDILENVTLN